MSKRRKRKQKSSSKGFKSKPEKGSTPKHQAQTPITSEQINQQLNLGVKYLQSGKPSESEACFRQVLEWQPDHPDVWHLLGVIAIGRQEYSTAVEQIQRAIALNAKSPLFCNNLGIAWQKQGKLNEAVECYRRALQLNPNYPGARNNLGSVLRKQGKLDEAVACYRHALQLNPNHPEAHFNLYNLGNALQEQGNLDEAIECYRRALQINPNYAEAHYNLGNVLQEQRKLDEAIECYRRALQINPNYAEAHYNLGNAFQEQRKLDEAIECYRRALQINPNYQIALQQYVWARRLSCDWDGLETFEQRLISAVQSEQLATSPLPPFTLLAVTDAPDVQLTAARNYCANRTGHSRSPLWQGERYSHDKIRLAYLSADYYQHPTAYLMSELFERHDRSRFELFAISFGGEDTSPMRQRLVRAFDRFIDVRQLSHLDAAQQLRNLEIDIAVDLKGYTQDCRPQILAHRPAPIQVNYLGYPSTMGADFIDYILVDPFIVPSNQQPYFSEKLVHLPECYQVNDSKRVIAEHTPSRQEYGLPAQGFVFCSFNSSYKITPTFFDIWMRLLKAVPGSVLWLLDNNQEMKENLRHQAYNRGINPDRLVFAPKQKLPEHLARHQLADLFLDNLPCNAHTTASDALWAGLPVLTCAGRSFAARVAGSLLQAIGLPELVTDNLEDYEALALKLATQPDVLHHIKEKLRQNRLITPLFDTDRFRRHIEAAYLEMWSLWQGGEEPRAFAVKPQLRDGEVKKQGSPLRSGAGELGGKKQGSPLRSGAGEQGRQKFAVTVISPPGYIHAAAFNEVAETIHYGLRSLGHDSVLTTEGMLPGRQHIILGSNLLPQYPLPLAPDAILYNLEQVDAGSSWLRPELLEIFRRYTLWDYSKQNAVRLEALGVKVAHILPLGYVKELTRIQPAPEPDIDVLFFGSINPRRQEIVNRMKAAGLRVVAAFGIYGKKRDQLISRAKLLLNVHFYDTKVLEMVRISYLLANHCAVLSEYSSEPKEDESLAEGVAFADYEHLVQRARELIDAPDERQRLASRGFEIISDRPIVEYLEAIFQ